MVALTPTTPRPRIAANEAHLPAFRPLVQVWRIPKPKRSTQGWLLFGALILLNEARGLYVAAQVWSAWFG